MKMNNNQIAKENTKWYMTNRLISNIWKLKNNWYLMRLALCKKTWCLEQMNNSTSVPQVDNETTQKAREPIINRLELPLKSMRSNNNKKKTIADMCTINRMTELGKL